MAAQFPSAGTQGVRHKLTTESEGKSLTRILDKEVHTAHPRRVKKPAAEASANPTRRHRTPRVASATAVRAIILGPTHHTKPARQLRLQARGNPAVPGSRDACPVGRRVGASLISREKKGKSFSLFGGVPGSRGSRAPV